MVIFLDNSPVMKDRPPDPHQNNPLTHSNNFTDGNPKVQPTNAIFPESTVKAIVQTSALESPPPATINSGHNCPYLNRAIDTTPQKTSTDVILAKSSNPSMTNDLLEKSDEALTGKNGNSPNELTPNLPNEPTAQITPTHEVSHQNNNYSDHPDQLNINGQQTTGKKGTSVIQPPPNYHLNPLNNHRDHFPPLTSNFMPQNRKIQNPMAKENTGMFPARQNATMPQSQVPTIQQLNSKFNPLHHQPVQIIQPNIVPSLGLNAVNNAKVVPPPIAPNVTPSYAARLKASQPNEEPHIEIQSPVITTKQGLPAVLFNRDDFMVKLASKCRFTLIGKFSTTMPKLEVIRKSLTSQLQIKGNCKVTHFNSTHVYIDLDSEIDHSTVWNKERIFIEGRLMRLLVWTPTFTPQVETTFAPVWVVLPELPWHCYTMPFVTKLLEPIGRVLFFDAASIQKTRGSVAKVKVEIDITKPRPPHLWLGFPQAEGDVFGDGRWQELQFESIPDYCHHCKHQGHSFHHCKVRIREEEYQKRKKDQEEKEKDKDPIQSSSSDQQRDQPEPPSQIVNKTSYERGQTAGTATKPQSKPQAIIVAKKTDIRNNVKQVYVPKNATQLTVDFSPTEVPHTTDSLVGQKISADSMRVSNQRPLFNTKNSFDVLIDVDTAQATTVATDNTVRKSDPAMTVTDLVFDPVISKNVSCHDVAQTVTGMESTQIHENVLQGNEKYVNTSDTDTVKTFVSQTQAIQLSGSAMLNASVTAADCAKGCATSIAPVSTNVETGNSASPLKIGELSDAVPTNATCSANTIHGALKDRNDKSSDLEGLPENNCKVQQMLIPAVNQENTSAVASDSTVHFQDTINLEVYPAIAAVHFQDVTAVHNNSTNLSRPDHSVEIDADAHACPDDIAPTVVKNKSESTKEWILKSFYGNKEAAEKKESLMVMEQDRKLQSNSDQNAGKQQDEINADMSKKANEVLFEVATDKDFHDQSGKEKNTEIASVLNLEQSRHDPDEKVDSFNIQHFAASKSTTTAKKKKKKHDKITVNTEELTEEEVRKAKIRAWQDAILAKSYAEIPVIESNKEPLNVQENKAAESIPSQESFDPAYAITMGSDSDATEKGKSLAEYVSPAHSGNKLTPTAKLEFMCKETSKMMREIGRGFYPIPPQSEFVEEEPDAPDYYLENLFDDSHNDKTTPSKDGKSKWNVNAPVFIPNALRQQAPRHEFPTGPSDEVLLQRLDLHDIRRLLHRQNFSPQELPQKFSSPHPGIIEDGSEYEDEDEDSTAYNKMAEARYAGLSPRFEQACKPKLIKKKRRPLEPKKKEAAPKKPKRVQPTRSSKSRSSRRK